MTSLWDQLPALMRGDHTLDSLLDLLSAIDGATGAPSAATDNNGRAVQRRTGHFAPTSLTNVTFDPVSGQFSHSGSTSAPSPVSPTSWLTFPDLAIDWVLDEYDAPSSEVALYLTLPSAVLTLPYLRGAMLASNQLLTADPAHPDVRLILPRLTIEIDWVGLGQATTKLVSATTVPVSSGTENVYQLCRMDPPHALIGPADMVGFGFDSAELYLDADPPGLPAAAHGAPTPWQGVHIADAHLYVAPEGMQGVAGAAGVHDLYFGFGEHSGVTGSFDVLVVEQGHPPTMSLSFIGSDGRTVRIPDGADTADVPAEGHLVVLLTGGVAPYHTSVTVGTGSPTSSDYVATPVPVTVPAGGVSVVIQARAGTPAQDAQPRTITLHRATASGGASGGASDTGVTVSDGRLRIVSHDASSVTVGLVDNTVTTVEWTWDGGGHATGATAHVPVAAIGTVHVTATYPTTGTADLDVYFRYDHPKVGEDGTDPAQSAYPFSTNHANTHTTSAATEGDGAQWSGGGQDVAGNADIQARLALLPAGNAVVTGYASFDSDDDSYATPAHATYNDHLAERRAQGAAHLLQGMHSRHDLTITAATVVPGTGYAASRNAPGEPRSNFWRATLPNVPLSGSESVSGTLARNSQQSAPPTPRSAPPANPSWFRKLRVQLVLERSRFVSLKILGQVDFYTGTERQLAHADTPQHLPTRPDNSMDGVTDMTLDIIIDDAAASWTVDASFRAVDVDVDGLWTVHRPTGGGDPTFINVLGAYSALAPVLAATAPASPAGGDMVPLAIASAAVIALAGPGVLPVKQVTLRGVEAIVSSHPSGTRVDVMVDVETKLGLDAGVVSIDLDNPVTVRYKSIGFSLGWSSAGVDRVTPTFDASKGYTIDIPAGAMHARPPLNGLLEVLGARVSRDNPTYIETELGLAVDLGIVEVDRARVRVRVDAVEAPTLGALGAGIDVGVLRGRGYLSIDSNTGDLTGSLDVTLADPLNLRVMAGLSIQHVGETTGVFVGMELDLPVPILLGTSGLGIYGFLGGVGVNMRRTENSSDTVPALAWLQRQPDQNPIAPNGWAANPGSWAFAIGALLGTVDGGFIFHLKGVVLLELPGPRLLLVMKADILSLPPALHDAAQQATILAVVDIDIGAGTITIGLVVDYSVVGLVSIHVPVQGYFSVNDPPDWYFDIGSYSQPATVNVFDTFTGSGYLMLHGSGISSYPPFPQLASGGFTIAVGFHVDLIWGDTGVGLYLKVGAGFDAIISFAPFGLAGRIAVEGELRLFIVSIGASAELDVLAIHDSSGHMQVWVHGEVCGHVDFFFFSVEGCVDFTIGSQPTPTHTPQPLVTGVQLVSRSPALVEGSGTDRSIDGVLAKAQQQGTTDPAPQPVPLDAIPAITFDVTPVVPAGFSVLGSAPLQSPGTPANAWVKRGTLWWRYTVDSVSLTGALGPGQTPSTWWSRATTVDPAEGSRLALLSWVPTPTPAAVPYGEQLTTDVTERWGSVCKAPAQPAPILWTFDDEPPGPSPSGWQLTGIALPDLPNTVRSVPPALGLQVGEPWRCGDPNVDVRRGIDPARVIVDQVPCEWPEKEVTQVPAPSASSMASLEAGRWLDVVTEHAAAQTPLSHLRERVRAASWAPELMRERMCPGAVLRSPFADTARPSNHRDGNDAKQVEIAWKQLDFQPDRLLDGVRFSSVDGLDEVIFLVSLPRGLLEEQLLFLALSDTGSELARTGLTHVNLGMADVPPEWQDATRPWQAPLYRAVTVCERTTFDAPTHEGGYVLAVVKVKTPPGTVAVDVGWDRRLVKEDAAPPFYVVAVQATLAAEEVRYSWDSSTTAADRAALSAALSQEPDDHALMKPGTTYTVSVGWHAEWIESATQPAAGQNGTATPAQTQVFTYSTDGPQQAPARLDPWILSTTPGPDEHGVFCDDPIRVVFATQKVADLFAAYGDRLEMRLRAASGNHPQPGGPRGPAGALASVVLSPAVVAAGALRVLSPWEQAVRDNVLDEVAGCLNISGERHSHSVVEVDYPLEPCTDYLLDIVRVGNGGESVVYRRGFTTGRFRSLEDFAATFAAVRVEHRALGPAGSYTELHDLSVTPTGAEVDAAFAAAGLDRPTVPRLPRVQVVWSTDSPPQPLAVVFEAAEPLWRSHPIPTQVSTNDPRDPTGLAWRDVVTEYVRPVRDPTSTAFVNGIVAAPGRQRGIVRLQPGQRETSLVLALGRDADPLALGSSADTAILAYVDLVAAPWEG
jgi:hypothetical protein